MRFQATLRALRWALILCLAMAICAHLAHGPSMGRGGHREVTAATPPVIAAPVLRAAAPRPADEARDTPHGKARLRVRDEADGEEVGWLSKLRNFPVGAPLVGARAPAYEKWQRMRFVLAAVAGASAISGQQWTFLGPQPEGNVTAGVGLCASCSGRVTALALSPAPGVLYFGAAAGGVWKMTVANGQATATPLTDSEAALAIGALAIDPSNPNTIYAGTGEQNNSSHEYGGAGVLKSTDGGGTWQLLGGAVFDGRTIGALAVSPTNPQLVIAAANAGLYVSTNGGSNWTRTITPDVPVSAAVFDPANTGVIYAAIGGTESSSFAGVYQSVDAGVTWNAVNGISGSALPTPAGRISLAMTSSKAAVSGSVLYAGVTSSSSPFNMLGFFQSNDGGTQAGACSRLDAYCPADNVPINATTTMCSRSIRLIRV